MKLANILPTVIAVALFSCGATNPSKISNAGGSINNGPGPVGDYLTCTGGIIDHMTLTIRATAAITVVQGALTIDDQFVNMRCVELTPHTNPAITIASTPLWRCTELREGEGLFHASVYQGAGTRSTFAKVTKDQIFPLRPRHVADLSCHIPE